MEHSFEDYFSRFDAMARKVDAIYFALGFTESVEDEEPVVNIKVLANMLHRSRSTIYAQPWLMPNNGEGEKRWTMRQVQDWMAIPEAKRKADYLSRGLVR